MGAVPRCRPQPGSQLMSQSRLQGKDASLPPPPVSRVASSSQFCGLVLSTCSRGCRSWPDGTSQHQDFGVCPCRSQAGQPWRGSQGPVGGGGAETVGATDPPLGPTPVPDLARTQSAPRASALREQQAGRAALTAVLRARPRGRARCPPRAARRPRLHAGRCCQRSGCLVSESRLCALRGGPTV